MNHEVKGGKKPNKTNLLHGNTEVVGVLSGTEEIREGRLTIQCLKPKLLSFFFFLNQFKTCLSNYKALEDPRYESRGLL